MAEVPPGPSSLLAPPGDALSPFPGGGGAAACPGALDEEEEEEGGQEQPRGGGKGGPQPQQHRLLHHHHPPHHNHQLNGLISPELRHLRASLKSKILSSEGAEGPENKRAGKTMGSGQPPPAAAPCSSPLPNHLPEPQARTAPPAATGDRSQPAAATAARNGLAGGPGLEEDEPEEGDEGEEEESLLLLSTSLAAGCSLKGSGTDSPPEEDLTIRYVRYESELQMPDIMRLITKDLSEPYSIYTYRYFIHNWPQLCFLVVLETEITNKSALKLYENLGFVRDKRLFRYYLNGVDALRLKLWLR
ncbi:N-alpha-acetyltransferase 30 isoform X5 [Chrysemys picta bellii]|uniref:N-alpha-acetyltransferase 30 isoform X5 n=1 Tax=Chrysemys picta bellii TaxID=8478 RepID=UPI000CE653D7|nr:N-alpha-acetyltransferase 30 isoform X3 [Chrysemys picta bellii]